MKQSPTYGHGLQHTLEPLVPSMIVDQNGVKRDEEYDESNRCTWYTYGIGFLRSFFRFVFVDTFDWAALGVAHQKNCSPLSRLAWA